jgi:uncharacterized protein
VQFEWDDQKALSNLKKHGVSFHEAASVFGDPLAVTFGDPYHSVHELRLLTFGITHCGKMIVVSHTERNATIRIISARIMSKYERKIYADS